MPIEQKDALEVFGYDLTTFDDVDSFRAQVEKDFLRAEQAHLNSDVQKKVFGKVNNAMRSTLKKHGKELEIDADFDTLDPIDGVKELAAQMNTKLAALKAAKADGTPDKEVAELKRQYEEAKKAKEDTSNLYNELLVKHTSFEKAIAEREATAKIDGFYSDALNDIPFKDDMSTYERRGFEDALRRERVLKFDDEGKEYVVDSKGERIKDPKKAASFLSFKDSVIQFAEAEKMTKAKGGTLPPVKMKIPVGQPSNIPDTERKGTKEPRKLARETY